MADFSDTCPAGRTTEDDEDRTDFFPPTKAASRESIASSIASFESLGSVALRSAASNLSDLSNTSIDTQVVRRLRVARHIQVSGGKLPPEFSSHWSKLGFLCPVFKPGLEPAFLSAQAEEMRKSFKSKTIVTVIIVYLFLVIGIDLSVHVALGEVSVRHYQQLGFFLLVSLWCLIFFFGANGKIAGRRRVIVLQNLSALVVLYIIFCLCVGFDGSGIKGSRTLASVWYSCVQILGILIAWGSLPVPLSIQYFLCVMHFAVIAWACLLVRTQSLPWYEYVSYILHLYGPSLLLFISFRKRSFERRMSYLTEHIINPHISKHDMRKIDSLSKEVSSVRRELSKERAQNRLDEHKAKLNALRADLEDPEISRSIQQTHESLVRGYVHLAKSLTDCAEEQISDLVDGFKVLRKASNAESRRLAKIMEELYDSFANLPEWHSIVACPSFQNWKRRTGFPEERLFQTSLPQWWLTDVQGSIPLSAEQIGLVHEPLEWYLRRAEWAKTPFVQLLKDAVRTFNEASIPSELGLDPHKVMDAWNATHPNNHNRLTGPPFPVDAPLDSNELYMSEMMQHYYVVHGRHAGLQVGPIKDRTRAHAKVSAYANEAVDSYPDQSCLEKYVCDWLRARVVFANPTALSIFFWYLLYKAPGIEVVQSKNKLRNPPRKDTSCNIHLNVRFKVHGEEHTAEVQLLLENFLIAMELEHKYYQFRRANRLTEILAPVLEAREPEVEADLARECATNGEFAGYKLFQPFANGTGPPKKHATQPHKSGGEVQETGEKVPDVPPGRPRPGFVHSCMPSEFVLPAKSASGETQNHDRKVMEYWI